MKVEIIKTSDNSNSLYVPELEESYHSVNGAVNESRHIFINLGLKYFEGRESLKIFEMGFGTGLNAFLTYIFARENGINIEYITCEAFPLDINIVSKLNYSELLSIDNNDYLKLHISKWNEEIKIDENFHLFKINKMMQEIDFKDNFDLIYYDAFSPSKQPELWSEEIFLKLKEHLVAGGVIVTYCAKNSFKRMLKTIGFEVESHPGPVGKREVTRIIKY
ncbi:MAG: tRNA (5-methylaminomethyl-2-thiouridine)(34)-methyltransferase MnmD [Bacteroidales bacterium]|jgi:tRNA U34 5-methylaminomethyl-2-thiouridine-forming methyltransferase MnmC|nr:tRNA (5-methylaminomethyl-2-thiouridine)(34)-methyltransferase MnmD [Bacteroidales bacterium]